MDKRKSALTPYGGRRYFLDVYRLITVNTKISTKASPPVQPSQEHDRK